MIWITTERKPCNRQAIDRLGQVYRIENGYMQYRGTLEEYTKDQMTATTVFELGERRDEAVNIPNGGYIQVLVDGMPLHVLTGGVLAHAQALDVIHDVHFRRTVFSIDGGGMVLVRSRRFASIAQPHLLCLEYVIQPSQKGTIVIRTGIDGDVWERNEQPRLDNFNLFCQEGVLSLTTQTRPCRVPVTVSETTLLPDGIRGCVQEEKRILQEITVWAAPYQAIFVTKFVAIFTGMDSLDPLEDGKKLCCKAAQLGITSLYQEHCTLWDKRWRENGWLGREIRKNNHYRSLFNSQES